MPRFAGSRTGSRLPPGNWFRELVPAGSRSSRGLQEHDVVKESREPVGNQHPQFPFPPF